MLKAIYHTIRLFRLRSKEPYSVYYKILGFVPNDLSIYEQAFLHRSSSIKTDKGKWINNERLEFLGDAVLDAVVADVVFHKFETKKEGFLTNTRSKIVQRETLNKLALELGLDKLVVSSTRMNAHNNYMYGNAFEAFIGAIYLDQGYDRCKQFIEERIIAPYIDLVRLSRKEVNFKSKLIEWSQKNKVKIEFSLIESFTDDDNNPIFQTQVLINGLAAGIGTGYSKKESQQNASKATLRKIQTDTEFQRLIELEKDKSKSSEGDSNSEAPAAIVPENISSPSKELEPELPFDDVAVVVAQPNIETEVEPLNLTDDLQEAEETKVETTHMDNDETSDAMEQEAEISEVKTPADSDATKQEESQEIMSENTVVEEATDSKETDPQVSVDAQNSAEESLAEPLPSQLTSGDAVQAADSSDSIQQTSDSSDESTDEDQSDSKEDKKDALNDK